MASKEHISEELPFFKNGKLFHSKRNPRREAEKQIEYVLTSTPHPSYKVFFALNPGLHFIRQEAEKIFEQVYCLYTPGWGHEVLEKPSNLDILFRTEHELISWFNLLHPSLLLFKPIFFYHPLIQQFEPQLAQRLQIAIQQSLKDKKQELFTRGFFSYKYKKNIHRNLLAEFSQIKNNLGFDAFRSKPNSNLNSKPNLLVVSGPSLMEYQSFLKNHSKDFYVVALPSTLAFLDSIKLKPDAIITTDPGYWAGLHLRYLPWFIGSSKIELWLGLCSETGSSVSQNNGLMETQVTVFSQTTMIERLVCGLLPSLEELPQVSESATVSATGLELLLRYTTQPIVVVGLDLGESHNLTHVHPHPFDNFFHSTTSRTNRFETNHWKKGSQNSSSLAYYRNWFTQQAHRWKSRVWFGSQNSFQIPLQTIDLSKWSIKKKTISNHQVVKPGQNAFNKIPLDLMKLTEQINSFAKYPVLGIHYPEAKEIIDLLLQLDFFRLKEILDQWPQSKGNDKLTAMIEEFIYEIQKEFTEP
jgi:hypothetical protein